MDPHKNALIVCRPIFLTWARLIVLNRLFPYTYEPFHFLKYYFSPEKSVFSHEYERTRVCVNNRNDSY